MKLWEVEVALRNNMLVMAEDAESALELANIEAVSVLFDSPVDVGSPVELPSNTARSKLLPNRHVFSRDHADLVVWRAVLFVEAAEEQAKIDAHNAAVLKNQLPLFPADDAGA